MCARADLRRVAAFSIEERNGPLRSGTANVGSSCSEAEGRTIDRRGGSNLARAGEEKGETKEGTERGNSKHVGEREREDNAVVMTKKRRERGQE